MDGGSKNIIWDFASHNIEIYSTAAALWNIGESRPVYSSKFILDVLRKVGV